MLPFVGLLVGAGLVYKFVFKPVFSPSQKFKSPFEEDARQPVRTLETCQKERDAILKQQFKPEYSQVSWDAIVIGSGIGGLSTAALLSRAGMRVLVLEQHDQAGGACHTFIDKGYEFDVGIHYIGEMRKGRIHRTFLDQISSGQIEWDGLDEEFDVVVTNGMTDQQQEYKIPSGRGKWRTLLKKEFPAESRSIDKFFDLVDQAASGFAFLFLVKILPYWLVKPLVSLGFFEKFFTYFRLNRRTVKEVIEDCTSDKKLQLLFSYIWGTYATPPSQAGFPMQALLHKHFEDGAYYPRGGASEIAKQIIPVIESSGGRVSVRSRVKEIVVENGKATGVVVEKFGAVHKISADVIVSDAGVYNTMRKLLPSDLASQSRLWKITDQLKPGIGCLSVFIGLNASNEELGLKAQNIWAFVGTDPEEDYRVFNESDVHDVLDKDYPFIFIGFPSAKDSSWKDRFPGKSTVTVVTFAPWTWFEQWTGKSATKRGDEYDGIKNTLGHRVVQQVCRLFPRIENHVDYVSVGTPVTNEYYLAAHEGSIYGLDHPLERFQSHVAADLRPETDIPGLYLTGQDLVSSGFVSALYGGLLSASSILKRNLYGELVALHKKIKAREVKP